MGSGRGNKEQRFGNSTLLIVQIKDVSPGVRLLTKPQNRSRTTELVWLPLALP